jgi:glycosyltransferase involved in cell wall biosynthesis
MRILIANSSCKLGGVSTFMLALRSALLARGHDCELFFFERGPMERNLPPDARAQFGSLADCLRLVAHRKIDVVHANNVDWSMGVSAVRDAGARLVLTAHKARTSAWTYGWTRANCDALTAVSRGVRDELQPYTDVPIQVVWNGIDTRAFTPSAGPRTSPPIVAWIGRGTSPEKALDRFAAIAPALREAGFRLWILDQHGPDRFAQLNPEAATLLRGVTEVWRGLPFSTMPDVYREVAASGGCIVSTSRSEGLSLALLEAQACRCLVIASDVRGNNECVSTEHGGVLFPFDIDPHRLAQIVIERLRDSRVAAWQEQAAAFVRDRFSVERMAADYLRIYVDAPFQVRSSLTARARARLRLSPWLHYKDYLAQRWGVGHRQFAASSELRAAGDDRLAAAAARAALRTSPTLYLRPRRLAHLVSLCA